MLVLSCDRILSISTGVEHGFTAWESDAYNALADWRSWDAMLSVFEMVLGPKDDEEEEETTMADMEAEEDEVVVDIARDGFA